MIQSLKDGFLVIYNREQIESDLGYTLTDRVFSRFINELQDPDGTFEDMALSTFDVILEDILADEAFLDHAPRSFLPSTKHD